MTGIRLGMAPMNITIFTPTVTAAPEARTITGTITVFGVESSDGRIIEAGAITAREPVSRVKMLVDHDHAQPVGYMTALEQNNETATATFYIPETPEGDRALEQAKAGLRDGLSIGAAVKAGGYFWDDDDVLHFTALELYETSLCAIPAFQDAQVEEVAAALSAPSRKETRMNREQLAAALAAGTITQAQHDAAVTMLDQIEASSTPAPAAQLAAMPAAPGVPVPAEYAAGPADAPAPAASVIDRPRSFAQVAADVVEAASRRDMRDILRTVNAALGEIDVASDAGNGFIGRPEWMGEVWQAYSAGRPFIDSLGGAGTLTGTKIEGYRWARPDEYTGVAPDIEGRVAPYAGDFAEVPTGKRKTVKVEAEAERWGFGSKIDRIFPDLGSADMVASLFGLLARDFDVDSDGHVRDAILAAATEPVDELDDPIVDTTVLGALTAATLDLKRIGASVSKVWVAENLFTEFSELTVAQLPAWLANQLGFVDVVDGSATVSSKLNFDVDFALPAGKLLAYDRRAATIKQSPQVRLESLDIAHGAVDIGFFAYGGQLINDERAIVLRTVS